MGNEGKSNHRNASECSTFLMKCLHHSKIYDEDDTQVHISIEYNCSVNVMDIF